MLVPAWVALYLLSTPLGFRLFARRLASEKWKGAWRTWKSRLTKGDSSHEGGFKSRLFKGLLQNLKVVVIWKNRVASRQSLELEQTTDASKNRWYGMMRIQNASLAMMIWGGSLASPQDDENITMADLYANLPSLKKTRYLAWPIMHSAAVFQCDLTMWGELLDVGEVMAK